MKFELTEDMLSLIDSGLQMLPFREAAPVLAELNRQITDAKNRDASAVAQQAAEAQRRRAIVNCVISQMSVGQEPDPSMLETAMGDQAFVEWQAANRLASARPPASS